MEKENNMPLVTVAVITYNSSEFVLETLESVKRQTYKNIELIVSDDCSKDETVDICKRWIEDNKSFFARTQLIPANQNTGIVRNGNRAIASSTGEWIKLLAGDDLLIDDAIESYVEFIQSNHNIKCCFGRDIIFDGSVSDKKFVYNKFFLENYMFSRNSSANRQYNVFIHTFTGSGGTVFYKREIFEELGYFDERFPMQEDHPYFIKVAKAGYKFYLLDKWVLLYRINPNSVCHKGAEGLIFTPQEIRYVKEYKFLYMYENLGMFWRLCMRYSLFIRKSIIDSGNSKNNVLCYALFVFYALTDPFLNYNRIMNVFDKMIR